MAWWSDSSVPTLVEVAEYSGESRVNVLATQLSVPASRANRVLNGWIELFASGPTPITHLRFGSRTPARLFNSLRSQTQLEALTLKWGDYSDLSVLNGMSALRNLELGGATALTDLGPLSGLTGLRHLYIEGCKRLTDYGALGKLANIESLSVSDSMDGPRLHADSIEFVNDLRSMKRLAFSPIVDSRDYSPLLRLRNLEQVWVRKVNGMSPSMDELAQSIPSLARRVAETDAVLDALKRGTIGNNPYVPPVPPAASERLEFLRTIDQVWSSLFDGRLTRIQAVRAVRDYLPLTGGVLGTEAVRVLEDLTGYPWISPPDGIRMELARKHDDWRERVVKFAGENTYRDFSF